MKQVVVNAIERIHKKLFGHPVSREMKVFLGNLSWSFFTGISVMPLMMVIATLAGRFMGPVEYGKYSLLLVINQFVVIFIFFGLDTTSVKYIAKAKSFKDKGEVISATSNFIFLMLALLTALALFAYPFLLRFSKDYSLFVILTAYYTLMVSIKIMFDLFIRGMENFKRQAQGKILEIVTVIITFVLVFFVLKKNNFTSFIFVLSAGAIAISLFYFLNLSKYFGKSKKKFLMKQLSEGKLFFIATLLGTLFLSTDRVVVAKYLGIRTLGIYSAYYLASYTVVSQITQLFTNVFFPTTARLKDKSFAKKIDKLLLIGLLPLFLLIGAVIMAMLLIFGKEYPINFIYVAGFALFSSLYFFLALYNTVILDISRDKYKKYLLTINCVNFVTIAVYVIATYLHIISISLILVSLILNSLAVILIQRFFIRSMQHN